MNSIKPFPSFKFSNLPQKLERKDYEAVLDLAVEDLKKNKDVVAVYSMGQNWLPGISDLDVVVVYRDGVSETHFRHPRSLSENARYIFTHDYMHFTESFFKNIYYVYPNKFDLYLLYGEDISRLDPKKELSPKEFNLLQASLAMDFLVTKLLLYPSLYIAEEPVINVRGILPWLYSFVYTIEMVEGVTNRKIISNFPEKIKSLRNNWFLNKEEENHKLLIEAMKEGFGAVVALVEGLDKFLKTTFNFKRLDKLVFASPDFYILGVEKWNEQEFSDNLIGEYVRIKNPISGKVLKNFKLLVPNSFFSIFSLYAKARGPYGDWFKKFLKCPDFLLESQGIVKRMEILNKIPIKKNHEALFTLSFHYGFHTTNYDREVLKINIVSLKRALKLWLVKLKQLKP